MDREPEDLPLPIHSTTVLFFPLFLFSRLLYFIVLLTAWDGPVRHTMAWPRLLAWPACFGPVLWPMEPMEPRPLVPGSLGGGTVCTIPRGSWAVLGIGRVLRPVHSTFVPVTRLLTRTTR